MANVGHSWSHVRTPSARLGAISTDALLAAGPLLLFGLRLWASVCLTLYAVFWLELDNSFWAGTTAAIVCQPQLGASLRRRATQQTASAIDPLVQRALGVAMDMRDEEQVQAGHA